MCICLNEARCRPISSNTGPSYWYVPSLILSFRSGMACLVNAKRLQVSPSRTRKAMSQKPILSPHGKPLSCTPEKKKTPPKPVAEEPKEEPPKGPPKSIDDLTAKIAAFLPGHSELVVISDRGEYYRIGRKRTLDTEIETHLDFIVSEMGGEWDNDKNEWRIEKK